VLGYRWSPAVVLNPRAETNEADRRGVVADDDENDNDDDDDDDDGDNVPLSRATDYDRLPMLVLRVDDDRFVLFCDCYFLQLLIISCLALRCVFESTQHGKQKG
jgi:hypothetical protein